MRKIKPYHGAGVLLYTKEEQDKTFVLLGRRSIKPGKGKWSIPGGGWDINKDKYDKNNKHNYLKTAIRETEEEISYTIKQDDNIIHLWSMNIPFFHFVVYQCRLKERINFNHNWEFSELKWFPTDKLPQDCAMFVESQVKKLIKKIK